MRGGPPNGSEGYCIPDSQRVPKFDVSVCNCRAVHRGSYTSAPKCRSIRKGRAEIVKTRRFLQPCGFDNVTCPCDDPPYRDYSGNCNNPINTALGSVDIPYNRVLRARYADGVNKVVTRTPAGRLPKARFISKSLFKDKDKKDPNYTLLLMQWGQLITHDGGYREDLTNETTGEEIDCCENNPFDTSGDRDRRSVSGYSSNDHADEVTTPDGVCTAIKLNGKGHSKYSKECVSFVRSEFTQCEGFNTTQWPNWDFGSFWRRRRQRPDGRAAQQLNTVSSYLDASTVYGLSTAQNQGLRTGTGGLLRARDVLAKEEWFKEYHPRRKGKDDNKSHHSGYNSNEGGHSSHHSSEEHSSEEHHSSYHSSDEHSSEEHSSDDHSSDEHHSSSNSPEEYSSHSSEEDEHHGEYRKRSALREFLPLSPTSIEGCDVEHSVCYEAGDDRVNSHPWLASLQTILFREHNRLARKLAKLHPDWDDETLFQEARRIVIAEFQFISYNDYLPKIIGKKIWKRLNLDFDERTNYSSTINPTTLNEFSHSAFRFLHSQISGTVSILSETRCPIMKLRLSQQTNDPTVLEFGKNFEGLVRGLTHDPARKTDRFHTKEMTEFGRDQVANDILRGRDHGVASYNSVRDICGLRRARKFSDFKDVMTEKNIRLLKKLYRSPNDVDLYVGGTLEEHCVDGDESALVGPTLGCIIAEQFFRWRRGDRYFFDRPDGPAPFTDDQYNALTKVTLAGILCDNLDEKFMQPDPFTRVSKQNELKKCKDIPSLDLEPWRTYTLPQACSPPVGPN
ncbi:peroxidase-like [Ischnura elegans]|uniref:peroxidase-like n=1 Tax=Ischnura elegans TaxID=197161 RepID=UPI001ED8B43A|nr:peroxidase-like [Ischnura elegans]